MIILAFSGISVKAQTPTDEILNYVITVDVNEDATLTMNYHLEWKVLDDSIGTVEWVDIGIPNSHTVSYRAVSDNISSLYTNYESGESVIRIIFTKQYKQDEIIPIDFEIVQDYMYEMNVLTEGETVYYLIPGWFKEIPVDKLTVSWNADKATAWSHGASPADGRLVWEGSVAAGQKFGEISVTYPSTAYNFNDSKTVSSQNDYEPYPESYSYDYNDNYDYYYDSGCEDFEFLGLTALIPGLFGMVFSPVGIIVGIFLLLKKFRGLYNDGSGLGTSGSAATKKKITRTLIKYYPECPGCGAPRPENADKCEYCGRSFIESQEVVEEKEITNPELYASEGTYRYGSSPNTFVRVHVTHIPAPKPPGRSCAHSSCAHSSCACAHSCACACACACAGGGRAGCSTKDFYNTNLKLKQLSLKKSSTKAQPGA